MIHCLAILLLCSTSPASLPAEPLRSATPQEEERPAATREEAKAAVRALKAAHASKQVKRVEEAIQQAASVWHADVAQEIAKSLEDDAPTVRDGSIEALRWMEVPAALDALTKHWKRNPKLRKDAELAPAFLRAIGQHADPSTIDLFADDLFENTARNAVQARVFALARTRDAEAIDVIVSMMAKVGTVGRRGGGGRTAHDRDFRIALVVLTGEDFGRDANAWRKWWSKNEKRFSVSEEAPELPKDVERVWSRYWKPLDEEGEDERRRGDRSAVPTGA